jgi:hypothetical protein
MVHLVPMKIKKIQKIIDFKVDMHSKPLQNTQHIAGMKAFITYGSFLRICNFLGVSPSGKAQGFDPCIPRFES